MDMDNHTAPRARRRVRRFALLEFSIVVAVTAALSAALLHRADGWRRAAEDAAARETVATLRTALQTEAARALAQGGAERLATLAQQNPMRLLARPPANYLGEFALPQPGRVARNGWVFDPRDKTLVYLRSDRESFAAGTSVLPKFKVEFVRTSAMADQPMMGLALNEIGAQGAR
jgi:type II secretory pathway pseudopilin PulG